MSDDGGDSLSDFSISSYDSLDDVQFGVQPYQFEPKREPSDEAARSQPIPSPAAYRMGDTLWCTCRRCIVMPENDVCVCCGEEPTVAAKIKFHQTQMCVAENSEFTMDCLMPFILDVEYKKLLHYHPRFRDIKEPNVRYRYTAYRQFLW